MEDRIKSIFDDYDPELSSHIEFMKRLEHNLNAVELIHQENNKAIRRNRLAVVASAIVGFLTGFMFSLIMPYIVKTIAKILDCIPFGAQHFCNFPINDLCQLFAWMIIGGTSVLAAVYTYNLTINFQPSIYAKQEG